MEDEFSCPTCGAMSDEPCGCESDLFVDEDVQDELGDYNELLYKVSSK